MDPDYRHKGPLSLDEAVIGRARQLERYINVTTS